MLGNFLFDVFIFLTELGKVEKEASELKTVVNVLKDEKKRQTDGK